MDNWTDDELTSIRDTREMEISSRRADGSLSPQVTIWAVVVDGGVYIRSVRGPDAIWYHNTKSRRSGRVWTGAVQRDITFESADHDLEDRIDEAYRAKFDASSSHTQAIIAPLARQTTIQIAPASL